MSAPSRRSIRLPDFDYTTPGAYFITVCTFDRACLFGEIVDGEMRVNDFGEIVREEWERSAEIRAELTIDAFVVMPNHFHGIVMIDGDMADNTQNPDFCRGDAVHRPDVDERSNTFDRATHRVAPTLVSGSLGAIVGQFKSITTKRINTLRHTPAQPVWQRNYYEHVIRDDRDLAAIRDYIVGNPVRWLDDENYPGRCTSGGEAPPLHLDKKPN